MYVRVHFGVNSFEASSSIENVALVLLQISTAGTILNQYIEVAQFFADAQKDTGRGVEFTRVDEGVHLEAKFGETSVRTLNTVEQSDDWNKFMAMVKLRGKLMNPN
jgi:hypothetical protein